MLVMILKVEELFSAIKTDPYRYVPMSFIIPCVTMTL